MKFVLSFLLVALLCFNFATFNNEETIKEDIEKVEDTKTSEPSICGINIIPDENVPGEVL